MAKRGSDDGASTVLGGIVVGIVVGIVILIAMVPKPVWIALGVMLVVTVVVWAVYKAVDSYDKRQAAAQEQARVDRAAQAAAAKRDRAEHLRRQKQRRIDAMGRKNADLVDLAWVKVTKVAASEAARSGWLGDVDFTADIAGITDNFEKAHALRKVTDELSALDKSSAEDRKILADAKRTAANLERSAIELVELIDKCATEAGLVDKSLQQERRDARTADQRAELHAKLSSMLYGIEATPDPAARDSTADAVMARVQAYREIKNRIQLVRDG
ncbi:hypothetical protein ACWDUN_03940 [Mycobacterium sp. NPDC003323]